MANGSTSARLCVGRRMLKRGTAAPALLRAPTLPTLQRCELVRDLVGVQRQAVLVGIGVLIGDGGEIDYHDILAAEFAIRVPDPGGDVHQASPVLREDHRGDEAPRR